ncbi:MAG: hypothetical protein FJ095_19495 [Deltaproteobacteria bacterium]|nr:hypothetical protein [Deltaproteobacteria bacterium]
MLRSLVTPRRLALSGLLASLGIAACGPVSGPWGPIIGGGEWAYVCDAPRQVGEACGTNDGCADGLYCT